MSHYFEKNPDKLPRNGIMSTDLYRGYVVTYEIKESRLVLKDIEVCSNFNPRKWKSVKNKVVKDQKDLVVDWYTGLIVLNYGDELINGKRPDCRALYEGDIEYILLQVENGHVNLVKKFVVHEYKKFKKRQFELFKKTKEYKRVVKELEPIHGADGIDHVINNSLTFYTRRILDDKPKN